MGKGKYMRNPGDGYSGLLILFFLLPVLMCWVMWGLLRDILCFCAGLYGKWSRSRKEAHDDEEW